MFTAFVGGALLGLGASLFWFQNRRVAGVSGILREAVRGGPRQGELVAFLAGLIAAGWLAAALGRAPTAPVSPPLPVWLVAGGLVGFGTGLANGCSSGDGVGGLRRFSPRSVVATVTFMAVGMATVFVVGHVMPGWSVR